MILFTWECYVGKNSHAILKIVDAFPNHSPITVAPSKVDPRYGNTPCFCYPSSECVLRPHLFGSHLGRLIMKAIQKALEFHSQERKQRVEVSIFPFPQNVCTLFSKENNAVLLNSFSNE